MTSLDHEAVKSYMLVVTVADGGVPQLSFGVAVSVQVTGVNEFTPLFGNSTYSVIYAEVGGMQL